MIRLVFSFSSPLPRACSRRPLAGVRIYRSRLATAATTHCGGLRNLTNRASVRQYRRRPRESFPPGRGGVGEHESYPAVLSHFASYAVWVASVALPVSFPTPAFRERGHRRLAGGLVSMRRAAYVVSNFDHKKLPT
jgi:hypothetical protein